jgi:aspartate ammonia-lyase
MKAKDINIFEANEELKLVDKNKLNEVLKPEHLLKEGFTIDDLK